MPRFHKYELSASYAIRRFLELGVTETKDILWLMDRGSVHHWPPVKKFFAERNIPFPEGIPWRAPITANLVRVVRQKWREGYDPEPRRREGLKPLAKKKKPGRKKGVGKGAAPLSKSAQIRTLFQLGKTTAEICRSVEVTPAFVRVVIQRSKQAGVVLRLFDPDDE